MVINQLTQPAERGRELIELLYGVRDEQSDSATDITKIRPSQGNYYFFIQLFLNSFFCIDEDLSLHYLTWEVDHSC